MHVLLCSKVTSQQQEAFKSLKEVFDFFSFQFVLCFAEESK